MKYHLTIILFICLIQSIKGTQYGISPSFPGGGPALITYINENLKYPHQIEKKGIQGRVYVEFTITKSGRIDSVHILKGVNKLLDQEAIRLVESMPDRSEERR